MDIVDLAYWIPAGFILLMIGIAAFANLRKGRAINFSIPGDGLKPYIPPDGMPMSNSIPDEPARKTFERRGADKKWHPVTNVEKGFFSNGSALVTNENGNPTRVSRRCLRCA